MKNSTGGYGHSNPQRFHSRTSISLSPLFFLEDLMGLLWLYSIFLISTTTRKRNPYLASEKSYSDKLMWQQERVAIRNRDDTIRSHVEYFGPRDREEREGREDEETESSLQSGPMHACSS